MCGGTRKSAARLGWSLLGLRPSSCVEEKAKFNRTSYSQGNGQRFSTIINISLRADGIPCVLILADSRNLVVHAATRRD